MFERFSHEARDVVTGAVGEARRRRDRHVGTEHLLLAVIASPAPRTRAVIQAAGLDLRRAREALDAGDRDALAAVGVEVRTMPAPEPDPPEHRPPGRFRRGWEHLPFTGGAKQTLELTLRHTLQRGDRRIDTGHILLALTDGSPRDPAHQLLTTLGVDMAALRADLERRLSDAA